MVEGFAYCIYVKKRKKKIGMILTLRLGAHKGMEWNIMHLSNRKEMEGE